MNNKTPKVIIVRADLVEKAMTMTGAQVAEVLGLLEQVEMVIAFDDLPFPSELKEDIQRVLRDE